MDTKKLFVDFFFQFAETSTFKTLWTWNFGFFTKHG